MNKIVMWFRKPRSGFLVPSTTLIGWSGTLAGQASDFVPLRKEGTIPVEFDRIVAELCSADLMYTESVYISESMAVVTTVVDSKWRTLSSGDLVWGRFKTVTTLAPVKGETSFSTSVEQL